MTINDGMVCGLETQTSAYTGFDAVILATGGMSYPQTGSSGDGYNFAREAGHTIIEPKPSLVPLEIKQKWCGNLTGLSLRNVGLDIVCGGENVYHDFGELLFTHFGISGPIVLSASAHMKENTEYKIFINLKPALTAEELDKRIVSDFEKYKNCDFINSLGDLLPIKLIPVIAEISGIGERKKVNSITKAERKKLGELIQGLPLDFMKFRPIEEAIITRGGVCVSEIDPKTMASKKVGGLYFAGEVIDVDAYTGGFNLQIVFSTARAAAEAAIAEAATAEAAADVSGNVPDNKTK